MRPNILLLCLSILAGCSSLIPLPEKSDLTIVRTRWNHSTIEELYSGRDIYINKCSGCHSLKEPRLYSASEWDTILIDMKPKAKLTAEENELIQKYLYATSRRSPNERSR